MVELLPLATVDADRVEYLLDLAFGSDRHARTAYRLRDGVAALPALSFAACDGAALVGTIQCWPVQLTLDDGGSAAMTLVGPVAVAPDRQRDGIGRRLTARALDAAARTGDDAALTLIGDPEYYGRFFGFSAERTGNWRLPGPVERHRLLARGGSVPAGAGTLGPQIPVAA